MPSQLPSVVVATAVTAYVARVDRTGSARTTPVHEDATIVVSVKTIPLGVFGNEVATPAQKVRDAM